jgi:anti-sigma factor RsiW
MMEERHPVSWLKLEQYHLGELSTTAAAAVERHLRSCEACRTCHARIAEDRSLPPLPVVTRGNRFSDWMRMPLGRAATAVVAVSALALTA